MIFYDVLMFFYGILCAFYMAYKLNCLGLDPNLSFNANLKLGSDLKKRQTKTKRKQRKNKMPNISGRLLSTS